VIDGTVVSVHNGTTQFCLLGAPTCSIEWDGGEVEVRILRMVKGGSAEGVRRLTLTARERCWESARVPEEYIDREVRVYGFDPTSTPHGPTNPKLARVVLLSE
jgi:hypothetical protein